MLNRRFLRIKVLQVLYAHTAKDAQGAETAHKELGKSVEKTHDLFFFLLLLYIQAADKIESIIEIRRNKLTASPDEKNPDKRFVDNPLINMIRSHETFKRAVADKKLHQLLDNEIVSTIARNLLETQDYKTYLEDNNPGFEKDKKFVKHFFEVLLYNTEELYTALEEKDIYWLNDADFVIKKIVSFIDAAEEDRESSLIFPAVYKKDDDRTFARDLLMKAILNRRKYEEITEHQIVNWDIERVTRTDRLVLLLGITEIIGFPEIPVKVSINEYIEISKLYSSPKNSKFVNGVLDKTVNWMKEKEMFKKSGRGLLQ